MKWTETPDTKAYVKKELRKTTPYAFVVEKTGWFWQAIAWLVFLISFGSFKRQRFMIAFATTLGPIVALPPGMSLGSAIHIVVHEGTHVRQAAWFGLCIPWIGPWLGFPLFAVVYGLLPIPVMGAVFRVLFEAHADAASWRSDVAAGVAGARIRARMNRFANTVASSAYIWPLPKAWVFTIFEWYFDRAMKKAR